VPLGWPRSLAQQGYIGVSQGPVGPWQVDYLIAATALTEGLELATLNIRRYPMFPELTRPF
jgi:predicted nucleic acid-binding protein